MEEAAKPIPLPSPPMLSVVPVPAIPAMARRSAASSICSHLSLGTDMASPWGMMTGASIWMARLFTSAAYRKRAGACARRSFRFMYLSPAASPSIKPGSFVCAGKASGGAWLGSGVGSGVGLGVGAAVGMMPPGLSDSRTGRGVP